MADVFPLILGITILLASVISNKTTISVTVVEITLGVIIGNLGFFNIESWMSYIASFGGILLTFLAGAEIDVKLMQDNFKESFTIGFLSFLIPFIGVFLVTYFIIGWGLIASLLTATALSETSIAVVYTVLSEKGLFKYKLGKLIMIATFITDICTAIALSVLFTQFNVYTMLFYIVSFIILVIAYYKSDLFFKKELEIKYVFVLLLGLIFFGSLGDGQAILPAFILGVVLSKYFKSEIKAKFQTVGFAFICPMFFIIGGAKVSIPLICSCFGVFIVLFILRQLSKCIGVYHPSKILLKENYEYITLMMSTGLTFGLVAAVI